METKYKNVTRTYSIKSYRCKICGVEFMHRVNFDLHYENHFDNEISVCTFLNIFRNCA